MSDEPDQPAPDKRSPRSLEDLKERILLMQVLLNFLVVISTIGAGTFGFWRYLETRKIESDERMAAMRKADEDSTRLAQQRLEHDKESLDLRRKEFRIKFFEREMELYLEACRATAALATAPNPKDPETVRTIDRFYHMYWGELCVVEGPKGEHAMIEFEKALRTWRERGAGHATDEMKRAACNLALQCRGSLEKRFDLDLGDLPNKPHSFMRDLHAADGDKMPEHDHDHAAKP